MPYSQMTIQELTRFMGFDFRHVQKMAERGEIPCQRIGGDYRFNRAEITAWLQREIGTMHHTHLAVMDASITLHRDVDPKDLLITGMLMMEGVCTSLPARTKNSVLKELTLLASRTGILWDPETLYQELHEREDAGSTALEFGIALPHPQRPQPYIMSDSFLVFGRTQSGIVFGAPSGQLTDLFFMTCSQDDKHHLHVLARLCRMLRSPEFVAEIRRCEDPELFIELMREREIDVLQES